MPTDPDARVKWPWVKAQKWALHIAYRLVTRYSNPPRCDPGNDQAFARRFAVSSDGRQALCCVTRHCDVLVSDCMHPRLNMRA